MLIKRNSFDVRALVGIVNNNGTVDCFLTAWGGQPIGEKPNSPGVGEMLLSGRYPMEQLKTLMGRYVERLEPNPKENFVIGKLPVSCYKNENRFCYDGAEDYQVRYIYLLIPKEGWRFRTVDLYKSPSQQSD